MRVDDGWRRAESFRKVRGTLVALWGTSRRGRKVHSWRNEEENVFLASRANLQEPVQKWIKHYIFCSLQISRKIRNQIPMTLFCKLHFKTVLKKQYIKTKFRYSFFKLLNCNFHQISEPPFPTHIHKYSNSVQQTESTTQPPTTAPIPTSQSHRTNSLKFRRVQLAIHFSACPPWKTTSSQNHHPLFFPPTNHDPSRVSN